MHATHGTLTPNVVTTVTFVEDFYKVTVYNRDTTNDLFFKVIDVLPAGEDDPAVGGADTYVVPHLQKVEVDAQGYQTTIVKLISGFACPFSVQATV